MHKKQIHIIAGPNGAGKTTKAELLLPEGFLETNEFVNADNIARGISPYNSGSKSVTFQAGQQMLKRIDNLVKEQKSFAVETTLSGRAYVNIIKECEAAGYLVNLIFLYTDNQDLNVARVQSRVARGGHNIEEMVVRRRYNRGIENLLNLYLPLVDSLVVYNGSKIEFEPKTDKVMEKSADGIKIFEENIWNKLLTISKKK
jgi:predicted ABC-type ATPase